MNDQTVVDEILQSVVTRVASEVGNLLGHELSLSQPVNRAVSKEDFFLQYGEKLVLMTMDVTGGRQGEAYMVVSLGGAIALGGTLLMVPLTELEERIKGGGDEYTEDDADSYGEIANIVSGVYTEVFDELHPKKLHFTKRDCELIIPAKVDMESPEPIPPQQYYLMSSEMKLGSQQLGNMDLLLPFGLLGWQDGGEQSVPADTLPAPGDVQPAAAQPAPAAAQSAPVAPDVQPAPGDDAQSAADVQPVVSSVVLVVAEGQEEAAIFHEILQEYGIEALLVNSRENIKDSLPVGGVKGVFLVMDDVNEQGVAAVIKLKAACGDNSPLIAAGPNWTRKTVLQATKYGACDIMITPATSRDIKEKVESHLV